MKQRNMTRPQEPGHARSEWSLKLALHAFLIIIMLLVFCLTPTHVALAQEVSENSSIYLPLIEYRTKDCPVLRTPTIFGMQTYGESGRNTPYFVDMMDSGASWFRIETYWAGVEPENTTPENFYWTNMDNLVRAANDGCLNGIITIDGNPAWAASTSAGPIDRVDVRELAEFLAAVVERYDGDGINDAPGAPVIQHIELYNEPDRASLPNTPGWGDHGAEYAEMLKTVYPAMKAANPNVNVMLGGIAYDNFVGEEAEGGFIKSFLTDVLNAGGGAYFDTMNFHFYPLFASRWTGTSDGSRGIGLYEKSQAIRSVLQQYGINKPLVITEGGWHSNADQAPLSSEQAQAAYVVQIFMQSYAAGIDFSIWWTLYDIDLNFYPFKNGLVTSISESNPPRRKQAYFAYQTLTSQIAPLQFSQKLPDTVTGTNQIEAYQFIGERAVYAAWLNPLLTTTTKTFRINASQVTERNMTWGIVRTIRDGDDGNVDGQVRVSVNGTPKYFEVNQ
ncbi:MAG TPA: hypothetical protein DCL15_04910 [Chloroflexi bacterium]|nr:hypothetical protein [Chloroflexota bacterium]HHW88221.1 glycoside hydrolase family 5 protein [Chloroflexota bacterium]